MRTALVITLSVEPLLTDTSILTAVSVLNTDAFLFINKDISLLDPKGTKIHVLQTSVTRTLYNTCIYVSRRF